MISTFKFKSLNINNYSKKQINMFTYSERKREVKTIIKIRNYIIYKIIINGD